MRLWILPDLPLLVQMFHGRTGYHLLKSRRSFKLPGYKVIQTYRLFTMADQNL